MPTEAADESSIQLDADEQVFAGLLNAAPAAILAEASAPEVRLVALSTQ